MRRLDHPAPLRGLGALGLLFAIPTVVLITLWPSHLFLAAKPRIMRGLEWLHAREMLEWLYWTRLEVLANVAMFVPVAMLLTLMLGARRWWLAFGLCLAATAGIELTQHFMPGRVASVQDIVANGVGAVIGVLLAAGIEALVRAARSHEHRQSLARLAAAQ